MEKTDERLEYLTAKEIFSRIPNLSLIFKHGSFYYCTCSGFQGCCFQNGEKDYCFICQFKVNYDPMIVEKHRNPAEIIELYKKTKENLKRLCHV